MIDQAAIESEIVAGLQRCERDRMDDAMRALDFYHGRFERYPVRVRDANGPYEAARYERHALLLQRIVHTLTANLYAAGPKRMLPEHPEAEAWLVELYKQNGADALLQESDRLSTLSQVCAIQVEPSPDPDRPLDFSVWDASSFVVWADDANPREAGAIATIDKVDETRRLRLYTPESIVEYRTAKLEPGQTSGGTAYARWGPPRPNPFGILPFAFVHHWFPAQDFWSGGPGCNLADANDYANFALTDSGDTLRYSGKPILAAYNVQVGWRPPAPARPGAIWDVPSGDADAAGGGEAAHLEYLQPDLGFTEASWTDLQSFIDTTLEMSGVPPNTIRMRADAASGVAIVAEQIPLILWAMGRQRAWSMYEDRLARVALKVGATHLANPANPDYHATAAQLLAAHARPGLQLRWPSMFPDLPGQERDTADAAELAMGITSRIRLIMKRRSMTRDEAVEELKEIAEDREIEQELLGPTTPPPAASTPPGKEQPEAAPDGKPRPAATGGDPDDDDDETPTSEDQ